jgi:hypothetical protein
MLFSKRLIFFQAPAPAPEAPRAEQLPNEKFDQYKEKVSEHLKNAQADLNEMLKKAREYAIDLPDIDLSRISANESGMYEVPGLSPIASDAPETKAVKEALLRFIVNTKQLEAAMAVNGLNERDYQNQLNASLEQLRQTAAEVRGIEMVQDYDPMRVEGGFGSLNLKTENSQNIKIEEREAERAHVETKAQDAAQEAANQLFRNDAVAGINMHGRVNATQLFSDQLITQLKTWCRSNPSKSFSIDLNEIGAKTWNNYALPEGASTKVNVDAQPSEDGRFLKLSWAIDIPSLAAADFSGDTDVVNISHVNALEIALDNDAMANDEAVSYKTLSPNPAIEQMQASKNEFLNTLQGLRWGEKIIIEKSAVGGKRTIMVEKNPNFSGPGNEYMVTETVDDKVSGGIQFLNKASVEKLADPVDTISKNGMVQSVRLEFDLDDNKVIPTVIGNQMNRFNDAFMANQIFKTEASKANLDSAKNVIADLITSYQDMISSNPQLLAKFKANGFNIVTSPDFRVTYAPTTGGQIEPIQIV